jgi:cysteine desulfurase
MIASVYLDNNATTQPLPEVVEAMTGVLRDEYANPSSVHRFGQAVRHRVETARAQVAALIGATPAEIVFTSSGTESINLAIRGALAMRADRRHFVTTQVEHSAVLSLADSLEREGYAVDRVGVDGRGLVDADEWRARITEATGLVSLQHANNETGVMQDVPLLASIAAQRGAVVHVDAVQSVGKTAVRVADWPVQLVSLSGHKFHGPKGAGALYVRRRTRLHPLIVGGRQERSLRAGTENVAGIVGLGVAAEAAGHELDRMTGQPEADRDRTRLRDEFEASVLRTVPFAHVHGADAPRIWNTSNIGFEGLAAEAILMLLSDAGVSASSGAACSSGSLEPSHVLKAMGVDERTAHGAMRFSLSRFTTGEELQAVVALLPDLLGRLKALAAR